jgi:antitoxin Phd
MCGNLIYIRMRADWDQAKGLEYRREVRDEFLASPRCESSLQRVPQRQHQKGPPGCDSAGVEKAVLVPIEEWRRLKQSSRPNLKSLLLEPGARFEKLILERGHLKRRPPMVFK